MADRKVSSLSVMAASDLDPVNDRLLVTDASASDSKAMAPAEMIRASLPYLSTFWDFTTGSLLPTVSFTRASTGWRWNSSGVLVPETTNVARFQYDPVTFAPQGLLCEASVTNVIRNNTMVGAVAGAPGTPPTNWTMSGNDNGLTRQIVGVGTEDGIDYIDVRYSGTPSASSALGIYPEDLPQMPAAAGQTWTGGFFLRLIAGSWVNISANITLVVIDSGSSYITEAGQVISPSSAPLKTQFTSYTYTPTDGAVAFIGERVLVFYTAGLAVDFTLRIGLPQLAQTPAITSPIKTSGSAVARADDFVQITNPQALADQCLIVRARTPKAITNSHYAVLIQVDDGSFSNRRVIYYASGHLYVLMIVGNAESGALDMGAVASDTEFVVAARFTNGNFAASLNGAAIVKSLTALNPLGLSRVLVGLGWNSTIKMIETRRTATDAELPLLAA